MATTTNPAGLDLNLAKIKLEQILNREFLFRESAIQQHLAPYSRFGYNSQQIAEITGGFIYLRKAIPEMISVGTSQIVFRLGGGYVGKTTPRSELEVPLPQDYYVVNSGRAYFGHLEFTISALVDLGFEVPEHHYFLAQQSNGAISLRDHASLADFAIATDLSEGGKFKVEDVEERHFESLSNGNSLREQLNAYLGILRVVHYGKHPKYQLGINGHLMPEGLPDEALRRIFLVVIDASANTGKLVPGDLNHIDFHLKS